MEVNKEYEYIRRDGRKVCIRRTYNIKGTKAVKKNELDEYFKNNAESIKGSKNLSGVLDDYNSNHDIKISFSMLYQKYKAVFGTRKSQRKNTIDTNLDNDNNKSPTKESEHNEMNTNT